jgi:hypothetical protein
MLGSQNKHITLFISLPSFGNAYLHVRYVVSINRLTRADSCACAQSCSVCEFSVDGTLSLLVPRASSSHPLSR